MRFSLALFSFVTAAIALPVSQPVARAPTGLVDLPELGAILGSLPQLDVSGVIAELNTTLHGALPTLSPSVIAKIQSIVDTMHDGAQLTGNHNINADFSAKTAGFNWGHGEHGHGEGEGGMGGGGGIGGIGGGDFELPPWLLDLIGELIQILGQVGDGPVHGPTGGPSPPVGTATILPIPPTDIPFPTDFPTDGPFPPTASTSVPTTSTGIPILTDEPIEIPTDELPTDDLPTEPAPTDDPTEPATTDLPTDTESTEDPSSTLAPIPTITSTFPTIPPPSETDTETEIDTGSGSVTVTGSASSTGTALGEEESDLPDGI